MAPQSRGIGFKPTFQGFILPTEPTSPEDEGPPTARATTHVEDDQDTLQDTEDALLEADYSRDASIEDTLDEDTLSSGSSGGSSDSDSDSGSGKESVSEGGQGSSQYLRHSNSSFSMANAFAPPFYNRPPTPLPPSPSLTSLLRPPFSAAPSRPTTPDSSENDTPNDTESAVAKSARTAPTVPRASPKVPTYEYYGFVLYITSTLGFLIYIFWSYLPSPFLHQLGIYYYPNRWWSLAIPSFLVMTIIYIYVALASYNTGYLTLPMNSIENIVDDAAQVAVVDSKGRIRKKDGVSRGEESLPDASRIDWSSLWNEGTDAVMDIPVGGVCEVLYGLNRLES